MKFRLFFRITENPYHVSILSSASLQIANPVFNVTSLFIRGNLDIAQSSTFNLTGYQGNITVMGDLFNRGNLVTAFNPQELSFFLRTPE